MKTKLTKTKLTLVSVSYRGVSHSCFFHLPCSEDGKVVIDQDTLESILLPTIPNGCTYSIG